MKSYWKSYSGEYKYKSRAAIQSMLPITMYQDAALVAAEIAFQMQEKCKWEKHRIPVPADW